MKTDKSRRTLSGTYDGGFFDWYFTVGTVNFLIAGLSYGNVRVFMLRTR